MRRWSTSTAAGVALLGAILTGGCSGGEDDGGASADAGTTAPSVDPAALGTRAAELTDQLGRNEWAAMRTGFDATMTQALSEDGLATAWAQVVGEKGAYTSRGEPVQVTLDGDVAVFDTPMQFEGGPMKSRISFNAEGEIAGLFILEPGAS